MLNLTGAIIGKDKLKDSTIDPTIQIPIDSTRIANNRERFVAGRQTRSADPTQAAPSTDAICKIESIGSVHSELDIKDEGPIYESSTGQYTENNYGTNPQQNYMTKTDSRPMSYYVMPQNSIGMPGMPMIRQDYYVQGAPSYVIQNPQANFLPSAQQPQQQPVMYQQQAMLAQPTFVNNVPYASYTTQSQYNMIAAKPPRTNQLQPRPQNPAHPVPRLQNRAATGQQYRYIAPRQNPPQQQPNVAMVRGNGPRPTRGKGQQQRAPNPNVAQRRRQAPQASTESTGRKTTSLIVLSDSDDEIEMIITEKTTTTVNGKGAPNSATNRNSVPPPRVANTSGQKPTITSDTLIPSTKGVIPPQILERMNQGGISITPVKSTAPQTAPNMNTQLVVVVNETGSHYALALPNGSKLILTPEQVAQIRASNGGKLIL